MKTIFRSVINKLALLPVLALALSALSVPFSQATAALTGSDFTAGHIIDDSIFTNANTMSVADIQNFLNTKIGTCDNNGTGTVVYNGTTMTRAAYDLLLGKNTKFTCINQYYENTTTFANNLDGNPVPAGSISAAQIIYNAAQQYSINPQVLLVTIQKEQGLITDTWPWDSEYQKATGYACPDNAPCNTQYYGFYNQVSNAAWQFRRYLDYPNSYNYVVGSNYILYSPDAGCTGSNVNIQNQATAALYDYTPYQPNSAALSGLNDSTPGGTATCGAYGNRNFWWYFNKWFGSPYFSVNINYPGSDVAVDDTGDIAVVPVVLKGRPASTIQLNYGVTNPSLAKVIGKNYIIFTTSNWNVPQYITVQGLASTASTQNFSLYVMFINSPDGAFSQSITPYLASLPMLWSNTQEAAVYRLYNSTTDRHAYAVSAATVTSLEGSGYSIETTLGYQCRGSTDYTLGVDNTLGIVNPSGSTLSALPTILSSSAAGDVPVTILTNLSGTDTIMSDSPSEIATLETNGYSVALSTDLCKQGEVPVYRLYDPVGNTHFYTSSLPEAISTLGLNFSFEGVSFYNNPADSLPVYRLYDPVGNTHFYTSSAAESAQVQKIGFRYEGIAWYAGTTSLPVYRLYDPVGNTHFYTSSAAESAQVQKIGFRYEGIAWYAK